MSLSWFNQPIEITREQTIIAARMGIGIFISFVITTYFTIVDPTWVYISLFVVLSEQKTIGATLIRSSMRTIATVSSALFSLMIILFFHNDYRINLAAFILGTFLYTYLFAGTKKGYIATLGSLTLAICLINQNNFTHVFIRPLNVLLGISIGLFALRFFFPNRATKMIILEAQYFLTEYATIAHFLASQDDLSKNLHERLLHLESEVIPRISRFQTLLNEADVEIRRKSQFIKVATDILSSLRHIMRYFSSMMASIIWEEVKINESDKKKFLSLAETFSKLEENLANLNHQHKNIVGKNLDIKTGQKMVPLMLRLITLECRTLETKITQLLKLVKTVKLE